MRKPFFCNIPQAYKLDKAYSQLPNNGNGDLVFNRDSVATVVDESGLVQDVAQDVPRINHLSFDRYEYRNQCLFSDRAEAWGVVGNITINQVYLEGHDGTVRRMIEAEDAGTGDDWTRLNSDFFNTDFDSKDIYVSFIFKTIEGDSNIAMRFVETGASTIDSRYVFRADGTYQALDGADLHEDSVRVHHYGNGWTRVAGLITVDSGTTAFQVRIHPAWSLGSTTDASADQSATGKILFYGLQFEEDSLTELQTRNDINPVYRVRNKVPHWLIEPSRTNDMPLGDRIGVTGWNNSNGRFDLTLDDSIGINGKKNATRLVRNSDSSAFLSDLFNKSADSLHYTFSVFAKPCNGTKFFSMSSQDLYPARIQICWDFETGEVVNVYTNTLTLIDYGAEDYGNGWFRFYTTFTSGTHTALTMLFSCANSIMTASFTADSGKGVGSGMYVCCSQAEEGLYPTSYISTNGTAQTRSAETYNDGNISGFNGYEHTLIAVARTHFDGSQEDSRLGVSDGSSTYREAIQVNTSNSVTSIIINNSVTEGFNLVDGHNTHNRSIYTIRLDQESMELFINGELRASDTSITPNEFDRYTEIGLNQGYGGNDWKGGVYAFLLFDYKLSDLELEEIHKDLQTFLQ